MNEEDISDIWNNAFKAPLGIYFWVGLDSKSDNFADIPHEWFPTPFVTEGDL